MAVPNAHWAAPLYVHLVSDLCLPIGIVDQERRTPTDIELRRQQHIGGKTPLHEQGDRTILTKLLILSHSAFSAAPTKTPHARRRAQVG
jgi:hypothetical protein